MHKRPRHPFLSQNPYPLARIKALSAHPGVAGAYQRGCRIPPQQLQGPARGQASETHFS
jgi:hypothetical protein